MKTIEEKYQSCREVVNRLLKRNAELQSQLRLAKKSEQRVSAKASKKLTELREAMQSVVDRYELNQLQMTDRLDNLTAQIRILESDLEKEKRKTPESLQNTIQAQLTQLMDAQIEINELTQLVVAKNKQIERMRKTAKNHNCYNDFGEDDFDGEDWNL
ncbi:MAG: hypothetical protein ACRC62_13095 [Microcoleus sp.]